MPMRLITMLEKNSKCSLLLVAVLQFVFATTTTATAQQWSQLDPVGGPPLAHDDVSGVFDAATHQLILFGGVGQSTSSPYPYVLSGDTWSLTVGSVPQWRQLTPSGTLPQARQGTSAVYDSANSRMIIFGGGFGFTSPCSNEIWVLSNANSASGSPAWTQLQPSGSAPPPRIFHTAAYDASSNRMIVFGGTDCFGGSVSDAFNDVWVLSNANGLGGAPVWTNLTPATAAPSPRAYLGSAYDAVSNRMTVFGGWDPTGANYNEVWVLANANGLSGTPVWSQLNPSGTLPAPRSSFVSVADPDANQMIIFGGGNANADVNETWVLSGANGLGNASWTLLNPTGTLPGAREASVGALDPSLNEVVVYGGLLGSAGSFYSDSWVLYPAMPSVTVTLSSSKITTQQALIVTVVVAGGTGQPAPGGMVTLSGGGYSSSATTLIGGSATFNIPAGALVVGTDTLTATYTPDVASALIYASSSGSTAVMVTTPPQAAPPTFTPAAGTYGEAELVTLASTTPGATMYYSTDGTAPTTSSTKYTVPVAVNATETIEAIVVASGYTTSTVASASYSLVGSSQVLTGLASGIATPKATINATVNDFGVAGQVWFRWGTTATALSSTTTKTTLPASTKAQSVNVPLTRLASKKTYYFQPVANTVGGLTYGAVQSFTTN